MANVYQSQYANLAVKALNTDSASYALTASYAMNGGGGGSTNTGSLLTTASAVGNTITFTKGNGSTFPVTVSGGTGAPGGSDTQLQFNSASIFSGSSKLTYNYANSILTLTGSMIVSGAISASFGPSTVGFFGTASWAQSASQAISSSHAASASYVSSNFQYEIHVSQVDGNDTTGDGSLLNPVATITKALTLVGSQRKTIIVHPGTYTESPSITVQYTTITGPGLIGGNIVISGTVSTSTGCTISGLKMTNLTITTPTGTGNVNILNCEISGTLTKSSNADYTVLRLCDYGAASITGAGLVAIFGGNPNFTTVNNASANVIIKSAITVTPVLTAGTLSLVDSVVAAAVTNAVTSAAGSVITLANCQLLTSALNNAAPVVLNGFYSILNTVYDKPSSTLAALSGTGGSTNSVDYFQYIDADSITTKGLTVTGSMFVSGAISASFGPSTVGFFGTASWAQSASQALTASFVQIAQTASYVTGSVFTNTNPALSASYALTASHALNGGGSSTPTFPYTGSAIISGSLIVTGSISSTEGFTGSLFGTASYITGSIFTSVNPALSASYALTASHALNGGGGTFNSTSSIIGNGLSSSFNINHGFNTRNLHITVYESGSNGETVYPDIRRINANTASIIFANPPISNEFIVYISQ
jgi:hypothetical protein